MSDITLLLNNYGQDMDQDDDGKKIFLFVFLVFLLVFNVAYLYFHANDRKNETLL